MEGEGIEKKTGQTDKNRERHKTHTTHIHTYTDRQRETQDTHKTHIRSFRNDIEVHIPRQFMWMFVEAKRFLREHTRIPVYLPVLLPLFLCGHYHTTGYVSHEGDCPV